jgi:hypothetical protein
MCIRRIQLLPSEGDIMHQPIRPAGRSGRRRALVRSLIASLVGLALIGVSAVPARATIYQKVERYSGSQDDGTFDACGVTVTHTVQYSGKFMIRAGTGKLAGAFFAHDLFSYEETWTNVTPGSPSENSFFTISGSSLTQDVRATHVEGPIFQFVTHQVGQPFVVRDMAGKVVLRDRGAVTITYLFDTGGDNIPGGKTVEDLSLRLSGPHPGFFLDPAAQCALLVGLIG